MLGLLFSQRDHAAADFIGMGSVIQVCKHRRNLCAGSEAEVEQPPAAETDATLGQRDDLRLLSQRQCGKRGPRRRLFFAFRSPSTTWRMSCPSTSITSQPKLR